jgi:hypothetical protein
MSGLWEIKRQRSPTIRWDHMVFPYTTLLKSISENDRRSPINVVYLFHSLMHCFLSCIIKLKIGMIRGVMCDESLSNNN